MKAAWQDLVIESVVFEGQCKFDNLCKVVKKFRDEWKEVEALARSCRKHPRQSSPKEADTLSSRKRKTREETAAVESESSSKRAAVTTGSAQGCPPQGQFTPLEVSTLLSAMSQPQARPDQVHDGLDGALLLHLMAGAGACIPSMQQQLQASVWQNLVSNSGLAQMNAALPAGTPAGITTDPTAPRQPPPPSATSLATAGTTGNGGVSLVTGDPLVSLFVKSGC